jgi:hypothetical protein
MIVANCQLIIGRILQKKSRQWRDLILNIVFYPMII